MLRATVVCFNAVFISTDMRKKPFQADFFLLYLEQPQMVRSSHFAHPALMFPHLSELKAAFTRRHQLLTPPPPKRLQPIVTYSAQLITGSTWKQFATIDAQHRREICLRSESQRTRLGGRRGFSLRPVTNLHRLWPGKQTRWVQPPPCLLLCVISPLAHSGLRKQAKQLADVIRNSLSLLHFSICPSAECKNCPRAPVMCWT